MISLLIVTQPVVGMISPTANLEDGVYELCGDGLDNVTLSITTQNSQNLVYLKNSKFENPGTLWVRVIDVKTVVPPMPLKLFVKKIELLNLEIPLGIGA